MVKSKETRYIGYLLTLGIVLLFMLMSLTIATTDRVMGVEPYGDSSNFYTGNSTSTQNAHWPGWFSTDENVHSERMLSMFLRSDSLKTSGSTYLSKDSVLVMGIFRGDTPAVDSNKIRVKQDPEKPNYFKIGENNEINFMPDTVTDKTEVITTLSGSRSSGSYNWSFSYNVWVEAYNPVGGDDHRVFDPIQKSGSINIIIRNDTKDLVSTTNAFSNGTSSLATAANNDQLGFTNEDVKFSFKDMSVSTNTMGVASAVLTNTDTSEKTTYTKDELIKTGVTESREGNYSLYITDNIGNTRTINFGIDKTLTSNYASLTKSYTVGAWYEASFNASYFTDEEKGTYNFLNEQDMQDFAFFMEYKRRVTYSNGKWDYFGTGTASSSARTYEELDKLINAVQTNSQKFYGSRKTLKEGQVVEFSRPQKRTNMSTVDGGVEYWNFVDDTLEYTADTPDDKRFILNRENTLPSYISSQTSGITKYVKISGSYAFAQQDSKQASKIKDPTAQYLGDNNSNGGTITTLVWGQSFKKALEDNASFKQGYYLITESDEAGNIDRRVVYLDMTEPALSVNKIKRTTEDGEDGEKEQIRIDVDSDVVTNFDNPNNPKSIYAYGFEIADVMSSDDVNVVYIVGNNISDWFLYGDEIPVLSYGNKFRGEYTITVFNRSTSSIKFRVMIAGKEPTLTKSNLTSNTRDAIFDISQNESWAPIYDVSIEKIKKDGSPEQLVQDDKGTPINENNLRYVFEIGGTFRVGVLDIFDEWIYFPIFSFDKGLPTGRLSVSENDTVRRDVVFEYDDTNAIMRVEKDGNLLNESDYSLVPDAVNENLKTLTILASLDGSRDGKYTIKLNRKDDIDVYRNYVFAIRCTISPYNIFTNEGVEVSKNGAINKPITFDYTDKDMTVSYAIGNGFPIKLKKGDYISQAGDYNITVRDGIGNQENLNIFVKLAVQYEIVGRYSMYDGKLLTNEAIRVSAKENLKTFTITNQNGKEMDTSQSLGIDGEYDVFMEDNYDNTVSLTIIVMRTSPEIQLYGVDPDGITNGVVKANFSETQTGKLYKRGTSLTFLEDYKALDEIYENGKYRLIVSDIAGNETTVDFQIKTAVDVDYNVVNGGITTSSVTIYKNEPMTSTVRFNGEEITEQKSYTASGGYEMEFADNYGNTLSLKFSIVAKRSMVFEYVVPDFVSIDYITKGESLFEDYTFENNTVILNDNGFYTLSLINLDTSERFSASIEVDNTKPTIVFDGLDYASMLSKGGFTIKGVDKDATIYLLNGSSESKLAIGSKFDNPGKYTIKAVDDIGNETVYNISIEYRMNAATVMVIVLLVVSALFVGFIIIKRKMGVKVR